MEKYFSKTSIYRNVFIFAIGIATIISYQNCLEGSFLFDDFGNIVANESIEFSSLNLEEVKNIFSPYQGSPNRKVTNITFAINYYFGQLNPVGFHFINILIHIINGWLIFLLFQWYLEKYPCGSQWNNVILSGIAALWWVTNPIQTNSVSYIVQRMTSLSTMFCLFSLLFYIKAKSLTKFDLRDSLGLRKLLSLYTMSAIAWFLALLSKEIAAIFPLMILIHEIYFFDLFSRIKFKKKIYLIFSLTILILFTIEIFYFLGARFWEPIIKSYETRNFSLLERLLTEPRVVFHYISLFLYPIPSKLHLYYDSYHISTSLLSPPTTMLAIIGTLLWLIAIIFFFKHNKLLSFSLLWVFIFLLIESTVIALELVFEHRFYLPSIGFVLALIILFISLLQNTTIRPRFFYLFATIIICSQILGTIARNRDWADPIAFSFKEVEKNPNSVRALTNLGFFLIEHGKPTTALNYLLKALSKEPDNIVLLNNIFSIFDNPPYNNHVIAQSYLQNILTIVRDGKALPSDSQALLNIAHYLFKNERYQESLIILNQIYNFFKAPNILLHIGQCNLKLDRYLDAQIALKQALQLEPKNQEIRFAYAWSLKHNVDPTTAINILSDLATEGIKDDQLRSDTNKLLNELQQQ